MKGLSSSDGLAVSGALEAVGTWSEGPVRKGPSRIPAGLNALAAVLAHYYAAEDYGLDIAALWPRFDFYREFHGLEKEMV